MKDYFIVKYKQNDIISQVRVEARYLILNILQTQDEIIEIKDEYRETYTIQYLIDIYKESIDIEYEDVTTVKEAYDMCYDYFKEAYNEKQISENVYNKYIERLKKYKREDIKIDKFIDKVKSLYVNRA